MAARMKFHCPECTAELRVSAEHAGKKSKCPKCQAVLSVPNDEPEASDWVVEQITVPHVVAIATSPQSSRRPEVELIKPNYEPALITFSIGVAICIFGLAMPPLLLIGPAVVSIGISIATFLWIDSFFRNTLELLSRIAKTEDAK